MTLLTVLDPAPTIRQGAYEFSVTAAARTPEGLEIALTIFNDVLRFADHVHISTEQVRAAAVDRISPTVTLAPAVIGGTLLELVPISERALRQTVETKPWGSPIPLQHGALPVFPISVFPSWIRNMVTSTAEALQVPVDMPAMFALSVLSTAVMKKADLRVKPGWFVPLNSYQFTTMRSGERKSPTFWAMMQPIVAYEKLLIENYKASESTAKASSEIAKVDVAEVQRKIKDTDADERGNLLASLEMAQRDLAEKAPKPEPMVFTDDVTTEAVAKFLAENDERLALLSDEGDVIGNIAGRYSSDGSANLGIYLKAYDGSPAKFGRITRDRIHLSHPVLTVGLCLQPSVLTGLAGTPELSGRGWLARFWFSLPRSRMGDRDSDPAPIDEQIQQHYNQKVLSLCRMELPAHGVPTPYLTLEGAAVYAHTEFAREIEPKLRSDGELAPIADWVAKLGGGVARIAGLLHMARHADDPNRLQHEVTLETMQSAILVGRYLLAHAHAAFGVMRASPSMASAQHIVEWLNRKPRAQFSARDVYRELPTRFPGGPQDAEPALRMLVDLEWIRELPQPEKRGRGRPQSQVFEVNPEIGSQYSQNSHKSSLPEETGSVAPFDTNMTQIEPPLPELTDIEPYSDDDYLPEEY